MNTRWLAGLVLLPIAAGAAARPVVRNADDLVFEGDNGISIIKLIETARDVTGEPFFFDAKDIENGKVYFTGRVEVSRSQFLPFFDLCLRNVEYVHLEMQAAGRTAHMIRRLGQQARGQQALKTMARVVSIDELKAMADRHVLVTTTLLTKNMPVRELVTTLQIYFADSATESIRNVEGTNAMIMTGFAANLASVVAMVDRMDAALANDPGFMKQRELEARVAKLEEALTQLQSPAAGRPAGR